MDFVENDEAPAVVARRLEQERAGGAEQQILEHGVVGEEDVRRPVLHFLPPEEFVGKHRGIRKGGVERGDPIGSGLGCLAGIPAENNLR